MKKTKYNNLEFDSLKDLHSKFAENGVTYQAFFSRIKKGWQLQDALTTPMRRKTIKSYTVDGKTYNSLKALSLAAGISYEAAVKRRDRGFTNREIFHGRKESITIAGIEYPTIQDARKKLCPQINMGTLKSRLRLGWSEEEAFEVTKRPRRKTNNTVFIDGREYNNLKEAYDNLKPTASFGTIKARVSRGNSLEEAFDIVLRKDGRKKNTLKITIQGESYTLKEASNIFKTPEVTIRSRIKRGATPEQAVGLAPIHRKELAPIEKPGKKSTAKKKTYELNGVEYASLSELARAHNLPAYLVTQRINAHGWSLAEAVKPKRFSSVVVRGVKYRSAQNAFEKIGKTDLGTFQWRKSAGYKLEVCLGLEPLPEVEAYEVHGKSYSTLDKVAEEHGLTADQLKYRLKSMSLEDALVYTPTMGLYSKKAFERDSELANSNGFLYFVKIGFESGTLHKIGITRLSVEGRFLGQKNIQLLATVEGTLKNIYQIEQEVLFHFSNHVQRAEESFDGRTETFDLNEDKKQELLDFIYKKAKEFRGFYKEH